ncbi:amidohydrolase family protein [Paenibacillus hodogayensis]|uniref:Amidohydrolase family protein n=1 Tax=Paenibacillus hodogayensis TaxID=279208 RepID=A0ABV5W8U2_9BACL
MYIDSHVHFWRLDRGDYDWLKPGNTLLYRDYLPEQLLPSLHRHQVEGLVIVQAAHTVEETDYMIDLAEQIPLPVRVIGGLNPLTETFREQLERLAGHPRFAGIRVNGSLLREQEGMSGDGLKQALRLLERAGLVLELLVRPDDLAAAETYLRDVPGLTAVIDHLGVPPVREQLMDPWAELMENMAALPNVAVKLSGMITQAGGYDPERLNPYVRHLTDSFGPGRLLFGSDWPVALLGGGYDDVVRLFEELLPAEWSERDKSLVRAENARRLYGLPPAQA